MRRAAAQSERWGFTLIEVVVTVALTSVLMLGLMSAVLIASKALPDANRTTEKQIRTGEAADQIASDVQFAVHITERTATAITFTVADRDGDGSPEAIRYAWSGTPGDPLTREYNHAAAVPVLENVDQFALAYDVRTVTEQYPGPLVEGPEIAVSSQTTAPTSNDSNVTKDNWIGQYFVPTLPADAVEWKMTRVRVRAKLHGPTNGQTQVQLRTASANKLPTATVLDQATLYESQLSSNYTWQELSYSGAGGLSPGVGFCLVLQWVASKDSATVEYDDGGGGTDRLTTTDAGATWKKDDTKSMFYDIYGKATIPGPPQTATRKYVTGLRMTVQAGDDASAGLDRAVHLPNTPEVLSAVWEYEGDTDPTALDMNADGYADWNLRWGGSINPAAFAGGVLQVDGSQVFDLDTVPDNPFSELTTIEFRYRCTEVAGSGVYFWINSDYTGGTFMPIVPTLNLRADMTQDLTVYAGGNNVVVLSGLPSDFVTVRLLIDPVLDTVNVKVNGAEQGTYAYTPYPPGGDPQRATLNHWSSNGEWDYVRIRVGGNNP